MIIIILSNFIPEKTPTIINVDKKEIKLIDILF